MLTVLSPLDHFGASARLIAGVWVGSTPLPNQYSGRHSSSSKSSMSLTESAADVTSGKIQVGAVPGGAAQVTVPACCGPVAAAGMEPNAPPSVADGVPLVALLLEPPLHAASIVAPATASAATVTLERASLIIA